MHSFSIVHKYDIDLANLHFNCTRCTQFNSHFEFNLFFLISLHSFYFRVPIGFKVQSHFFFFSGKDEGIFITVHPHANEPLLLSRVPQTESSRSSSFPDHKRQFLPKKSEGHQSAKTLHSHHFAKCARCR